MTFHRTPAEMAADASFARSPIGESKSRHLLWLTDDDLVAIGPEPRRTSHHVDFTNAAEVAAERAFTASWKEWWSRACLRYDARRREALSDPAWAEAYERLIARRRADGPAELAALQAEWKAYDDANPERGLTDEEIARRTANWARRTALAAEHRRLSRRDQASPRLAQIIVEMRECDRINDDLYALEHSRTALKSAA